jgi:NAF domain
MLLHIVTCYTIFNYFPPNYEYLIVLIFLIFLFLFLQKYKKETRFTSKCSAKEIVKKIEEAAKPLGFDIQKKNYKVIHLPF